MKGHVFGLIIIIAALGVVEIAKFLYKHKKLEEENELLKSGELDWSEV